MSSAEICISITIFVYLVGMILVGAHYAKQSRTTSDFYLGGRQLSPLVTAMSAEASDMSSYLLMGLPGLAYLSGVADVGWTVSGLAIGTYLNWLFTARRLRRYSQITNSYTLPQFFSSRYHDKNNILCLLSAIIIIVFFIPYTASGFAACGKLFSSLFGADYMTAMILSAVVVVAYTAAGGFLAASITDFIQSIIMTFAILFVVIYATASAGGIDAVADNVRSLPGYLSLTQTYVEETGTANPYTFLTILSTLAWGLGYFGMPHILLRFMAVDDEKKLGLSRRVASIWVVIAMAIAVMIGIAGRALANNGVIGALSGSATETVLIEIADLISQHGVFMAVIAGIILSGILASIMSTADSQLLAASSSVSQNILQEKLHMKLTPKQSMLAARGTVILIAILGILIARDPNSSIFGIVSSAWAGFGASFGPLMICALFWKRSTLPGAVSGMVVGGAFIFIWKYLIKPLGGIWGIYELLPAFLLALLTNIIVSLLTKEPDAEIIAEFEKAKSSEAL